MGWWIFPTGLACGYLCGSLPFSWLLVRFVKGIDMRFYGSRTVSGSMVGILVSKPAGALAGILDILKALLPVWLAQHFFPATLLPITVGVGAFLGHSWPVWLRFQGGRGVSVIMGTLLVLFPFGPLWILLALAIGKIIRAGGILVLISLGTMPFLAALFNRPREIIFLTFLFFLLTIIKRLEANREPLPKEGKGKVILRRIFLDRDIADHHAWLHRKMRDG